MSSIPIISAAPLVGGIGDPRTTATAIRSACCEYGFFYVSDHGISDELQRRLETASRDFFRQSEEEKQKIAMSRGGRAWRGYFPVGGELTSGQADLKEGLYFGSELPADHPDVKAQLPLHGSNLFPTHPAELGDLVLTYIAAVTQLGHALMRGIALSLGLAADYFDAHYTHDPLVLFRIFNYPAPTSQAQLRSSWGVGEHTDYGVLTILKQDDAGGLEVKSKNGWIAAPPIPGTFVCNLGDMLDRMTGGLYKSTLHRVRNASGRDRLSWPFFFDPNFHAAVKPLPLLAANTATDDSQERWDKANVHAFSGTYGDYVLGKIAKVFPLLKDEVL